MSSALSQPWKVRCMNKNLKKKKNPHIKGNAWARDFGKELQYLI
jgi:hypothetical protein